MNVYKVTNGYMGYNYVHVIVIAANEQQALTEARIVFERHGRENRTHYGAAEDYWTDLSAEQLNEDSISCGTAWCSKVMD